MFASGIFVWNSLLCSAIISDFHLKRIQVWFVTRLLVMCSEGVASVWGTLALPLAASKGQKVGGVPFGDLEREAGSESVSHPNTKLQREWQWARITTACTSSARDQHCSPAFSSAWQTELRVRHLLEFFILVSVHLSRVISVNRNWNERWKYLNSMKIYCLDI